MDRGRCREMNKCDFVNFWTFLSTWMWTWAMGMVKCIISTFINYTIISWISICFFFFGVGRMSPFFSHISSIQLMPFGIDQFYQRLEREREGGEREDVREIVRKPQNRIEMFLCKLSSTRSGMCEKENDARK